MFNSMLKRVSRIFSKKKYEKLYVFLDIDGVLNLPETYDEYGSYFSDNLDAYPKETEYEKFNNNEELNFGIFGSMTKGHGEIYDKRIVKQMSKLFKEVSHETEVILISSAADIPDCPVNGLKYWSKQWGMNIVDNNACTGDGIVRYKYMQDWLSKNASKGPHSAILIDDIPFNRDNREYKPVGYHHVVSKTLNGRISHLRNILLGNIVNEPLLTAS